MKKTFILSCVLVFLMKSVFSQEIFRAVMSGDLEKTKILLEEHPEWANATSWGGWTPLHRASQFGHGDIVDFLILKGSHLEARTDLGMTPLYAAIMGQKSDVVKQLIDKGADIFAVRNDGETMLHIAAAMGQKDIVEWLISKGLKVNETRRYGITPLHLASVFGHESTVEALISKEADIDRKNDNGSTALHLAAAAGETEIAALLKEKGASDAPEEYVTICGDYLGQKKPGSTPEPFASGILLNTHRPHGNIAFSPDNKEIYWAAALTFGAFQKIWMIRQHNGRWSSPKAVSFPDPYTYGGPAISPDGERFFFVVHKPAGPNGQNRNHDIWYQEKDGLGWGDVIKPGPPLNSDKSAIGPSVSRNGTVYFYSFDIEGGFGSVDIYCSKLTKDGYKKPENLGNSINTEFMDTLPYIAPDESYLLFSSMRPDGYGDFDLYVSYKKKDGIWTKAKNLGATINTSARESISVVSPDGKYLFFMSRRNGIGEFFWVDAKIIEDLKPKETTASDEDILKAIRKGDAEDVKAILSANPDLVKIKDKWGRTPLHFAVDVNNVEIMKCLIENGADVEATDKYSWTPLFRAIDKGKKEAAEVLIAKGADVNHGIKDGFKPVHLASSVGNIEMLELLIQRGADQNAKNKYGLTPLHIAAAYGFKGVVEIFLSYKTDVNAESMDGRSPVHFAQAGGNQEAAYLIKSKGANAAPAKYPEFKGKYLGFEAPGLKPEILFPGIIIHLNPPHNGLTVSPDSKEIYWAETSTDYDLYSRIWFMKESDGRWKPPQVASFSNRYLDGYPCFSVDGKRMIFSSNRPLDENMEPEDRNIWYVEKTDGRWSQPKNMGSSVNTDQDEDTPTIDKDGTLYFSRSEVVEGRFDINIYRSKLLNGQYEKSEKLEETVNSPTIDVYPFIAPDGSYLIYNTGRYGVGFQLCISFLKKDGSWTEAKAMKEVLGPFISWCQGISTDGQYLFFAGHKEGVWDIYWVDARIIDYLK